jgi:hypothetical protein
VIGLLLLIAAPSGALPVPPPQPDVVDSGGFKDGNELYQSCQPDQSLAQQAICLGYIQGLSDELEAIQSYRQTSKFYCASGDVTVGEVKDAIVGYLAGHAAERAQAAASLGTLALGLGPINRIPMTDHM